MHKEESLEAEMRLHEAGVSAAEKQNLIENLASLETEIAALRSLLRFASPTRDTKAHQSEPNVRKNCE